MTTKNLDGKIGKQHDPHYYTKQQEADVFSSRSHAMDYFTVEGVKLRTGYDSIKDWYIMVIQQLLDNAADFLQKHYKGFEGTEVNVWITKDAKNNLLRIRVQNTNYAYRKIPVFSDLEHIFDFKMKYGSKQNDKVISRGILGDGEKQILALPYVLLHSNDSDEIGYNDQQWKYPLTVRHNGKESNVWVIVDIYNQVPELKITQPTPIQDTKYNDITEIEVFLPLIDSASSTISIRDIEYFCRKYPILTTDISFKFHLASIISGCDNDNKTTIAFDAIHPISSTWNNKPNIRYYKLDEFARNFTTTYDRKSTSVYDVLQRFRGGNRLKKTTENQISIEELLSNPNYLEIIEGYYYELIESMKPTAEISLPYVSDEKRKQELLSRLCNNRIDSRYRPEWLNPSKSFYKLIRGYYHGNAVQYPFAIEVLAVPFDIDIVCKSYNNEEVEIKSVFLPSINYSFAIKSDAQNDVKTILGLYGFNFANNYITAKYNVPSVILVNIISPRLEYTGHDKSSIDTSHFKSAIYEAAQKIQRGIPTCRAAGINFIPNRRTGENSLSRMGEGGSRSAIWYLEEFIRFRIDAVDQNPDLRGKGIGRIPKQGTFYRIRPKMEADGFVPPKDWGKTRKYLVSEIDEIVFRLSHGRYEREDLGIIAGARGMLYYRGEQIPIHIDNFREIAKKGVVVVIIEKEGLPDILADYAKDYAVALVNTRGHVVTDIKRYIEEVKKLGSPVVMLVDFDYAGHDQIATETFTKIPTIGIERESIKWFNDNAKRFGYKKFDIMEVAETYTPTGISTDPFLRTHRVEIDSILAKVGNKAFWEYIVYKLQLKKFSPNGFDYTRNEEVKFPDSETLYPKEVTGFIALLDEHTQDITADEREEIEDKELVAADKLIDITKKEQEIENTLKPIVAKDKVMMAVASSLKKLTEELNGLLVERRGHTTT